jgi:hypothetical protein
MEQLEALKVEWQREFNFAGQRSTLISESPRAKFLIQPVRKALDDSDGFQTASASSTPNKSSLVNKCEKSDDRKNDDENKD